MEWPPIFSFIHVTTCALHFILYYDNYLRLREGHNFSVSLNACQNITDYVTRKCTEHLRVHLVTFSLKKIK